MTEQATCGCGKMVLAANERMGTLAGGATVTKSFCFDCLTLLEADGETVTVTPMVPIGLCSAAKAERDEAVAVGEWLAKEGTDEVCARCGFWHICHYDDNAKIGEGDCEKWLVETARAAVRKQREVTK